MSVKSQFLKKLQARQPSPVPAVSKSQADITAFRQRMAQLQDQMDAWLTDTGLNAEPLAVYVPDLLVEGGAFDISGIVLRYGNRAVKFMPIFLYGQGVAGCVEVTFFPGTARFLKDACSCGWGVYMTGSLLPLIHHLSQDNYLMKVFFSV